MAYSDKSATQTASFSTVARKKSWADLDLSLTKHPIKKDIMPLKDDNAIKNAVKNLILTNFHERPFQLDKGADLRSMLFEPANEFTSLEISDSIKDVLSLYEPRIRVTSVNCVDDIDKNAWNIRVNYTIRSFGIPSKIDVTLKRLR